ncbi:MAG: uroporphyrinogen-III synthase [Alphaproteobacteria bacterium]|nr:uroporphyrinogen-III synthase [Alphaproteobacteria bacterium]
MMTDPATIDDVIIVTRPDDSGKVLQDRLATAALAYQRKGRNIHIVHLSVMTYRFEPVVGQEMLLPKIKAARGLAFTSAHGVEAFIELCGKDAGALLADKKIFAVGDLTAAMLRASLGVTINLSTAGGDVEKLSTLMVAESKQRPDNAPQPYGIGYVHIGAHQSAGEARGQDLVSRLRAAGLVAEKMALYNMVAITAIAPPLLALLGSVRNEYGGKQARKHILFFSPRTVQLTSHLLVRHGLVLGKFIAHGFSDAVLAAAGADGFMTGKVFTKESLPNHVDDGIKSRLLLDYIIS